MWLRLGLFFVLSLAFQCETAIIPPRADSAAWLFMGQRQAFGEMPGRDLWDNKLPLIYLVGRLAMFTGHPQVFLWLVEAALTAAGALAVSAIVDASQTSNRPSRSGTLAGVLLCITTGAVSYHAGGYMTEIYAMPLSAIAAWCTLRARNEPARWVMAMASGLLWTLAVSFRLPFGLAAVAIVSCVLFSTPKPFRVRLLGCHLVGILGGAFVIFFHPVFAGYLRDCIDAAILWPLGIGHDRVPGPFTPSTAKRLADWAQDALKLGWLHAAAIGGIVVAWRASIRTATVKERPSTPDGEAASESTNRSLIIGTVALWYAAAMFSAAWGWASYAHYQYVAFAPMCLGIGILISHLRPPHQIRVATSLLVVTTAVVGFQVSRELWRYQASGDDAEQSAAIAFINNQAAPEDSVLVWAWGRSADALYRLNRSPGTRHFMAHSYFDMDLTLFNEFSNHLKSDWILEDSRRDKPPLRFEPLKPFSPTPDSLLRVQQLVSSRYQPMATFGPWRVFKRRPPDFLAMPATQPSTP